MLSIHIRYFKQMLIMYKNPLTCILSDTHNVNHKPRTTTKTSKQFFSTIDTVKVFTHVHLRTMSIYVCI